MWRLLLLGLLTISVAPSPGAQQAEVARKRPALPPAADTNDAEAYYALGHELVYIDPSAAADAFYWATRLNPYGAHGFYGRYAALLLEDPRFLVRYIDEDKKLADSPRRKQIDSLFMRALMLDPFFYRKYEHLLFLQVFREKGASDRAFVDWIDRGPMRVRALVAYCEGRFADALRFYAAAIPKSKQKALLRFERARTFYLIEDNAGALAELTAAIADLRKRESEALVIAYDSKALLEFSIGRVHERTGDLDAAREAYGRALQEDLAFYPAHVELGMVALQRGDTASALGELAIAIDVNDREPMLRLFYGYLLSALKRYPEAEAQLVRAIELEPEYARSYQLLGEVYEAQQRRAEAISRYESYLWRATRRDAPREEVARRLGLLRAQSGDKR